MFCHFILKKNDIQHTLKCFILGVNVVIQLYPWFKFHFPFVLTSQTI